VLCGDDARALAMAQALEQAGYWVAAIRPPTVPEGKARLRVTLSALHGIGDVDGLVEVLARRAIAPNWACRPRWTRP
jgi:8-amino-7-oxononanoate synthase